MTRLLLADDHLLFRQGLRGLLSTFPEFTVVGEAASYGEAISVVRAHPIDVAILDVTMPGRDGIEMIAPLKALQPKMRILMLTMHREEQYATRALRAGADGYITKNNAAEQVVAALRRLATGGQYICPTIAERLAFDLRRSDDDEAPHTRLSNREFKIFEMLVEGRTVTQIANELTLSVKTVSTHKVRLLRKMSLASQSDLVRYAMERGLTGKARAGQDSAFNR